MGKSNFFDSSTPFNLPAQKIETDLKLEKAKSGWIRDSKRIENLELRLETLSKVKLSCLKQIRRKKNENRRRKT